MLFWLNVMNDPSWKGSERLRASELLAERGWGRAPQLVPVEDADSHGQIEQVLDAAVLEFNAEVRRLAGAQDVSASTEGGDPSLAARDVGMNTANGRQ